jgi:ParB family chromosome partitioning protein
MTTKLNKSDANSGAAVFIPLSKLKKSPKSARKMPHGEATIEALAASIAAKGLLQNLVVEPEIDADGAPTGCYLVTIGEGRRLAQLLRVKRKEIKKTEPIRCTVDLANDQTEISLDENVTRADMHPADQFEAFKYLAEEKGYSAEDIAARFGITAHVVRQRMRLASVSPKLIQIYRDGELTLEQLIAFAITTDHARQDDVFERLGYNREAYMIRRMLTETNVPTRDRRVQFVGLEAYEAAGGTILRDLFTDDGGGYLEDAALLDRLTQDKLDGIANALCETEGWKWAEAHLDYPHAHGLRRVYPSPVDLSDEDATAYEAAQAAYNALSEQYESCEELPDEVDERFGELEAAIERFEAKRQAYAPEIVARAGAFVVLSYDGTARIERGFVRREDEASSIGESGGASIGPDNLSCGESGNLAATEIDDNGGNDGLSDALVRDLTAHRTLGLRIALGEAPDIALIAVIHAMVGRTFYHAEPSCLDIRPVSASLSSHADGIADTKPAIMLAERHDRWAAQLPQSSSDLWGYLIALDHDSRMALFAHCAALTVFAVTGPWIRSRDVAASVDQLVEAVDLNMSEYWTPTARSYFGRIPKSLILAAVRDAAGPDAAERLAGMKKAAMAEAAERLVAGTGWLPGILVLSPLPSGGSAVTSDDAAIATARPSMIAAE